MSRSKNKRRRTRRGPAQQTPPQAAAPAAEMTEPVAGFDPDYPFADVDGYGRGEVDERQLMLLVKDWRKGRATRSILSILTDGYVAVFSIVIIAAMVVSAIRSAQNQAAGCTTEGCSTARELIGWLVLAACWVIVLAASRVFGPVIASAAEGFWLLDAPLRRSAILARRLWMMVVGAGLVAAALSALVTALTGLGGDSVLAWTIATGLTTTGWMSFAAAQQGAEKDRAVRVAQLLVGSFAVAILLTVIATASGWFALGITTMVSTRIAWAICGVGLVLCVLASVVARRRLSNIGRARLVSGGELVSGMQGAAFALDFALMRDILIERRYQLKGHVAVIRGRGRGTRALIWRDIHRLRRNPIPLVGLAIAVIVPYALSSLGIVSFAPFLSSLVLMVVIVPFLDSMRVLSRTKGLARLFPMSDAELRDAVLVVPGVLALGWAIAVTPAFVLGLGGSQPDPGRTVWYGVIAAVGGVLGAMRWVSAKSADYSAPMVATGAGAVPPSLMFNMVRGLDMVVLVNFPLVMNWSPIISAVIAIVAWVILRSGASLNQEELLEAQAESRRELEKARAESRSGRAPRTKQVISRSTSNGRTRPPLTGSAGRSRPRLRT
ncbi:MAG: ABC transporter permease [Propionibacteriaceae bacterium]|nr:ABC transporter permease [Propionibacteriaceae bacterium]